MYERRRNAKQETIKFTNYLKNFGGSWRIRHFKRFFLYILNDDVVSLLLNSYGGLDLLLDLFIYLIFF